ncbi:response regulator aspartate phosphatase, partial [Bacillus pumilus]
MPPLSSPHIPHNINPSYQHIKTLNLTHPQILPTHITTHLHLIHQHHQPLLYFHLIQFPHQQILQYINLPPTKINKPHYLPSLQPHPPNFTPILHYYFNF